MGAGVRFSCVIDARALFARQATALVCTLARIGVAPGDIVVHHTPGVTQAVVAGFAAAGVNTVPIDPFCVHNPYLNKLRQLDTPFLAEADLAILCDCDIAFVRDIRADLDRNAIAAQTVDRPNPPIALWEEILRAASLHRSRPDVPVRCGAEPTLFQNRNGGLYAIPGERLPELAGPWAHWARWLVEHAERLGDYAVNVDQMSFALTCLSEGIDAQLLPADCNVPTHLPLEVPPRAIPSVLHYHRNTDADGLLLPVGVDLIDAAIVAANAAITAELSTRFRGLRLWQNPAASDTVRVDTMTDPA